MDSSASVSVFPAHFGSCSFEWLFQLAPVSVPILEVDFLPHHNLLLDVANQKVFSNSSPSLCLASSPPPSPSLQATFLSAPKCISDLLYDFPDVLSFDGFTASLPRHQIHHHLLTHPRPPVFANARLLDPDKLSIAKASSPIWKKQALSAIPPRLGHLLSTWSRRRSEAGGLVVTIIG